MADIDRLDVMDAQMHQPQVRPKGQFNALEHTTELLIKKAVAAEREAIACALSQLYQYASGEVKDTVEDIIAAIRRR